LIEQSNVGPGPTVVNVSRPGAIESAITNLDKNSGGLLILPADWFFAARQEITEWARQQQLPDFWPVTNWVIGDQKSPIGGFGVSQQKCGELLGEQIAEVWKNGELVGGLYGVRIGKIFFGESMFSKQSKASKYAFIKLVEHLKNDGVELIDCQVYTEHLESLGARMIPRTEFLHTLKKLIPQD
jgi:hypothetical protein